MIAAVMLLLFGFAAPAQADDVSQIAKGLTNSRLYVTTDSGASLTDADKAEINSALANDGDADIRAVVVKPGHSQQALGSMLKAVGNRVGEGKTYVAIDANGREMVGVSKDLSSKEINQLIAQTSGGGIKSRLTEFGSLAEKKADDQARSSMIGAFVTLGVVILLLAAAFAAFLVVRGKRRKREEQQMAELKQGVEEDVTLLGEDIAKLDLNVMDQKLDPEIRSDYERAMNSYDEAKSATAKAAKPQDMQAVTTALEDGRYYMTATRARMAGEPVPEKRAPCFFNPNHGPSTQDVMWAPPGSTPRSVPACEADAQAVLSGGNPDIRMVPYGDGRRPYWDAGPAYGPYAGGYYSSYGGMDLLSGMMIGTMLGSMMGGWGGGYSDMGAGAGDMGGFGGDGGDVGGGWDFGSGDFGGGGDFGGF
ncbi:hypothetical protein F8566_05470 [Actinomadura rudentiformis]|uniref:TPM domain-containing protein n=2 Tax=Actinomadura rudentiformis TaxID=359158 RepID=A0A6H9Z722_9ACTN|nr:hypothetical protein F8566_05470 [Actinomadura rudentiformis]